MGERRRAKGGRIRSQTEGEHGSECRKKEFPRLRDPRCGGGEFNQPRNNLIAELLHTVSISGTCKDKGTSHHQPLNRQVVTLY